MSSTSSNNKCIAKNTIYLYFRTLIVMVVSLYTSRIILQALGVDDFGIYNVVAGITAMIGFINGTLADASQRFITFELGKTSEKNINRIFSTCLILHFIIALIVVLLLEPVGIWFISNKLQIPYIRLEAAHWIFQFTILQLFISFISVPYNALIIANEKMSAFAFISIVEVFLRLCIAFITMYCTSLDKLIVYGFCMVLSQLIIRSIYILYCKRSFKAIEFGWVYDKKLLKEIGKFASWTVFGNLAYACVTQGLNLLLGMFFLPAINAARGIAVQVQAAINTFVKNFQTAINPQITKNYAAGNLIEMHSLVFRSSRFSFFLIYFIIIPVYFEVDIILRTWLVEVPSYAAVFLRIILLSSLINSIGNPLAVSCKATGDIKYYEIFSASIKLLVLPIAYIALLNGCSPTFVFIIQVIIEFIALLSNIIITSRQIGFSKLVYFKDVVMRLMFVSIFSLIVPIIIFYTFEDSWVRFIILGSSSCIWTLLIVFTLGLSNSERLLIVKTLKKIH